MSTQVEISYIELLKHKALLDDAPEEAVSQSEWYRLLKSDFETLSKQFPDCTHCGGGTFFAWEARIVDMCTYCSGTGRENPSPCRDCQGSGVDPIHADLLLWDERFMCCRCDATGVEDAIAPHVHNERCGAHYEDEDWNSECGYGPTPEERRK